MESSQFEQVDRQRKDSSESSVFSSALGAGQGINFQALKRTPPPKRSPNVSPATYFGVRRPAFAGNIVDPPAQDRSDYIMNAGPVPGVQVAPPAPYPSVGAPGPMFFHKYQVPMVVPDGRQRKLALQPFDGKELYRGLGSGFLE